jgi:hypothetical protein
MAYAFSSGEEANLALSSNSTDLSIDILAEIDAPDSENGNLLFDSTGSGSAQVEIIERMFIDATTDGAKWDEDVHRMSNSMIDLTFDPVDEYDELAAPSRRNSLYGFDFKRSSRRVSLASNTATRRCRSPASPSPPRKRISVKDVDFDPTPSLNEEQQQLDDLTLCSFTSAQTSQQVNPLQLLSSSPLITMNPDDQVKYQSAVASLVKSMERTELSRRQVVMQRSLLGPDQHAALEEARIRQLQAIQTEALIPVQTPASIRELSPTRSSIANAFFAGKRGTLTNGLEQSRRQLRSYMSQVQTL